MNIAQRAAAPALAACLALLTACGGGGGGGSSEPGPAHSTATGSSSAQGAYEGMTSEGREFSTIVLDNNEFYTVYGFSSGDVYYIEGFVQGNGRTINGTFASDNLRDFYYDGSVVSGSLSASYVAGASFNGSVSAGGSTQSFEAAAVPKDVYDYDAPADLSRVAGSWQMEDLAASSLTVTIDANGRITGSSDGCVFSGSISPRASGKNVFDVSATFGPAPCVMANQPVSGIALETVPVPGVQQLVAVGMDSRRTAGTLVFGTRQIPAVSP